MRRMFPVRLLATILPTLTIACVIAINAALAFNTYYLVDIKAKSSRVIGKWQSTIPGPFATNAWVRSLDGLSPPVDDLVISYKKFYLGWVCWPHDCVGNRVVFLIAQDGSEAYGMLRSKALKADDVFFGAPSAENRERLKDHLDK
jgi:Inhibitor of vertebrate lysozyme (Ivy)